MFPEAYNVVVNDTLCISHEWKQFRFPKRKNNRSKKKWMNNSKNWGITKVHQAFELNGTIYMSSYAAQTIVELYNKNLKKINEKSNS